LFPGIIRGLVQS
jgi:hypothetical protein